jgi:allantoate deiminase
MTSLSSEVRSQRTTSVVERCRKLAAISDVPGETTRLYLSPATGDAHSLLRKWFREAGLEPYLDDVGNLRATRRAVENAVGTVVLFSHIDTVPNAGAFDGVLGVILALEAITELGNTPLPYDIELIAFSEEEGVRFNLPFLSSRAVVNELTNIDLARIDENGISIADAIRNFGKDPTRISQSCPLPQATFAAVEVHIEQGPVLDTAGKPLAIVEGIAGQTRTTLVFKGQANHAGTTPMSLRHDALAAAAQFISEAERYATCNPPLVATVGRMDVTPGAMNSVAGGVRLSLDVRHPDDNARNLAVTAMLTLAKEASDNRGVHFSAFALSEHPSVRMNRELMMALRHASEEEGHDPLSMFSGAGHDAGIIAAHFPTAMLFIRSPQGLSHHPDEAVRREDVGAALSVLVTFLRRLGEK